MLFGTLMSMAVAGLLLLIVGLRGRRVGRDWHCGRCGYCLAGIEELGVCPECEARVSDPVYRVIGRRVRWRRVAWVGVVLLAIGGPGAVALPVMSPPGSNPYAWMPDWLLVRQGASRGTNGYWFWNEIVARLDDGRLTEAQRTLLATRAHRRLMRQQWYDGAPGVEAAMNWAPVFGAHWQHEAVTDEELEAVLAHIVTVRAATHTARDAPGFIGVELEVEGALHAPAAGRHFGAPIWIILDGEAARVSDSRSSARSAWSRMDVSIMLESGRVGSGFEVRIARPMADSNGTAYATARFWVIVIEVPPQVLLGGRTPLEVTVRHEIVEADPLDAAMSRYYQRMNAEAMQRIRRENEERQSPP